MNPRILAQKYTLDEIEEKIEFYMEQVEGATVASYTKDTTQGSQKVDSADIDKIQELLDLWMNAYGIKSGHTFARTVSINFKSSRGGIGI